MNGGTVVYADVWLRAEVLEIRAARWVSRFRRTLTLPFVIVRQSEEYSAVRLGSGYNYSSSSIRPPFDCISIALKPFDNLSRPLRGLLHCGLNKQSVDGRPPRYAPAPLLRPWAPKRLARPSRRQRSSSFLRPTRSHAHRCSCLTRQRGGD